MWNSLGGVGDCCCPWQRLGWGEGKNIPNYKSGGRMLCLFSGEKRILRGDRINACKYLWGGCQEDGARLFQWCPGTEQGAMAINWNTRSSTSKWRTLQWQGRALGQLFQGGHGVSLSGDIQTPLNVLLCHCSCDPALVGGLGWTISRGPFQPE